MTTNLPIARDGNVLGEYPVDKISDLLENGTLLPTDFAFSQESNAWIPLAEWKPPTRGFARKLEKADPDSTPRSSRRRSGSKKTDKKFPWGLVGWILALITFAGALGVWTWAQSLQEQLAGVQKELVETKTALDTSEKLRITLHELAASGEIRGVAVAEPAPNRVATIVGLPVMLYNEDVIRNAISKLSENPVPVDQALADLPALTGAPLSVTLTDANGRFLIKPPEPGRYVLFAQHADGFRDGRGPTAWMLSLETRDNPSELVILSEKNALRGTLVLRPVNGATP